MEGGQTLQRPCAGLSTIPAVLRVVPFTALSALGPRSNAAHRLGQGAVGDRKCPSACPYDRRRNPFECLRRVGRSAWVRACARSSVDAEGRVHTGRGGSASKRCMGSRGSVERRKPPGCHGRGPSSMPLPSATRRGPLRASSYCVLRPCGWGLLDDERGAGLAAAVANGYDGVLARREPTVAEVHGAHAAIVCGCGTEG